MFSHNQKTLVLRQRFSFFAAGVVLVRPACFRLPSMPSADACIRRNNRKHLTNLIFNCKNDHYRPVYKWDLPSFAGSIGSEQTRGLSEASKRQGYVRS